MKLTGRVKAINVLLMASGPRGDGVERKPPLSRSHERRNAQRFPKLRKGASAKSLDGPVAERSTRPMSRAEMNAANAFGLHLREAACRAAADSQRNLPALFEEVGRLKMQMTAMQGGQAELLRMMKQLTSAMGSPLNHSRPTMIEGLTKDDSCNHADDDGGAGAGDYK
uniref:Uncharacterized protein n=1 Tax=Haptolina brevifila TaxID=156173 RepID=A0A7S2I8F8_9EUKA|mmetsp:Transcript_62956/g.124415  ORF Transcript_62956/g.124415 Transcript_62956/m.124415 type:complete len:168 (+) Transcript_62956:127-630(+)